MIFYIKNNTQITGLSGNELRLVKNHLTIENPLFHSRLDMGLSNWNVPKQLQYFEEPASGSITVPNGALPDIIRLLDSNGVQIKPDDIIDARYSKPMPEFFSKLKFTGELRHYQQSIVDTCMSKTIGVVEAMTGSGKTITFVALTMLRQEATLILVNTIELANQAKASFLKFTNMEEDDIGLLGNGEYKIRPVMIGLHQTMYHLDEAEFKFLNTFVGQVIADEVHIIAANTYYNTICKLDAKYKFGFSATPYRDDGLTPVIHYATGPTIHVVPKADLVDVLITPSVRYINTEYYFPFMVSEDYLPMINDLSVNKERNQLIYDTWLNDYQDKWVVMLCSRVEQVLILHEMIGKDKSTYLVSQLPGAIPGKKKAMKKKDRLEVMRQLQNKEKRVIISTFGLFSTGIDLPHLDALFMCAPIKSTNKVKQSVGRLTRKAENKTTAEIVDFVDYKIDMLNHHAAQRKRIFKTL
jgi:superfamily II DNA or RNA helicase